MKKENLLKVYLSSTSFLRGLSCYHPLGAGRRETMGTRLIRLNERVERTAVSSRQKPATRSDILYFLVREMLFYQGKVTGNFEK